MRRIRRRQFGRQLLQLAASMGLTSVSLSSAGTLSLLGACAPGEGRAGREPGNLEDLAVSARQEAKPGLSAVVVGSGYGAAVTALRLTEAGVRVTMLEAGRLWKPGPDGTTYCKAFEPDGRAMWFREETEQHIKTMFGFPISQAINKEAGIIQWLGPKDMRVACGKGVGGGSLANIAVCLPPSRERFARILPMVDGDSFFDRYVPLALAMLRANRVSARMIASEFYRYTRAAIEFANASGYRAMQQWTGYDVDYLDLELDELVPRSALAGEAGFGNNYGKNSLDKTYLADALGTGLLTIHALHEVKSIRKNPSGGFVLDVEQIDVLGNVLEQKSFTCTHLFLGAGSMGTSSLLVRARERGDLPDLNPAVGTKWGPNGQIYCALDNPLWRPTGDQQSTVPTHYFHALDQYGHVAKVEIAPLPVGLPLWTSNLVILTDSPEAGSFTYDPATDTANLQWERAQNQHAVSVAKYVFDNVNARGGTHYSGLIGYEDGQQYGDVSTYHPVGGVPLGSATDDYGRIREYPGLYVSDGSLIPVGLGTNPLVAITALAERNVERVIAEDLSV